MSQVHDIHTSCKNCIFALYNNITQTGCKLQKLELWEEQGLQILEVYDEDKEFFVINDKRCPYKRNLRWGQLYPKDEQIEQIEKEVTFRYHAIVFANDDIDETNNTINNLAAQSVKPEFITLVRWSNNKVRPSLFIESLQNTDVQWKLENITNPSLLYEQVIDMIVTFCKSPYYGIFHAGFSFPEGDVTQQLSDIIGSINTLVKQAIPFILIAPTKDCRCTFIHTITHRVMKGNKTQLLVDKIKETAKKSLIKSIDEI